MQYEGRALSTVEVMVNDNSICQKEDGTRNTHHTCTFFNLNKIILPGISKATFN